MGEINIENLDAAVSQAVAKALAEKNFATTAQLADIEKAIDVKYQVDGGPTQNSATKVALADSGVLGGVTEFKIGDIPVGAVVVGGGIAVFASELVDGFLIKQKPVVRGAVKLGGAVAALKFGKGIFGDTGSKAIFLLLAFDGLRDIIPLDTYAQKLASKVTHQTPTAGLAQKSHYDDFPGINKPGRGPGILKEAGRVVTDYYAGLSGR